MDDKLIAKVEEVLSSSDIVWGKYGMDTIDELAVRLVTVIQDHNKDQALGINGRETQTMIQENKNAPEWRDKIDVETLELRTSCFCVLGQLDLVDLFCSQHTYTQFGFDVGDEPDSEPDSVYDDLREEWIERLGD